MKPAGIYRAVYFVTDWTEAALLITELVDGVVASFGDGDDQWDGLDVHDPGATIEVDNVNLNETARVRVEVRVPIEVLGDDHWFSPHATEDVETFNEDGTDAQGEAWDWGLV